MLGHFSAMNYELKSYQYNVNHNHQEWLTDIDMQ